MDKYSSTWPVWTDFEGQENRAEWRFTAGLVLDLEAWALNFETNYRYPEGWLTQSHRQSRVTEGQRLQAAVQAAAGPNFYVELVVMADGA